MKIDILFPVLPPTIDGIGDHTARLAAALSGFAQVRILMGLERGEAVATNALGLARSRFMLRDQQRIFWDLVQTRVEAAARGDEKAVAIVAASR